MSQNVECTKFSIICVFTEWKATVTRYTTELLVNKPKAARDDAMKLLREKATNIYKEVIDDFFLNRIKF